MILSVRKLEYYKNLDELPVFNWFKLQETNDLAFLLLKKRKCSKTEISRLENVVRQLTDEYIDTFGISDEFRNILELKRDLLVKKIDLLLTGKRINKTFIAVLEDKLKAALNTKYKSDTASVSVYVSKYMGYQVNMKTISVKEFYSIINEIKKEAAAKRKQNER